MTAEMRYLDDFVAGQSYDLGSHTVSADEIVRFAREWDPQSFHTDPTDAAHSAYGGLIASGWHTASIFMRLYVTALLADSACLGSPGVDDLAWLAPVRPDDTLSARVTIEDVEASKAHPGRGRIRPRCELRNQDGVVVFTMVLHTLMSKRTDEHAPPTDAGRE
ncbi:MAG: MaoC family dehydratase [Acidimicrobiales bacterium]